MSDHLPQPTAESDDAARKRAASFLGRVISKRYRIDDVIAMGGMGAVYRGEHVHMRRRIAIKILHPDTERLPELVKRFEREAIAGAHIQHQNVATATDFGEMDDGSYFLVLEYVRGVTLHEIIRRGPLPVPRAVHIARQLAAALDAVHAIDIVHRDVKPRNVMVAEAQGDLVKLIDFGLAKVSMDRLSAGGIEAERAERISSMPDSNRLTGIGVVFGTIAYLGPEAALGMDFVDACMRWASSSTRCSRASTRSRPEIHSSSSISSGPSDPRRSRSSRPASRCRRRSRPWCSACSRRFPPIAMPRAAR
jgi:serine/threonine protein kinase